MYVDIDEMKRHLNILFNDDDLYLAELEEAAENTVAAHLNRPSLAGIADGGRLPGGRRLRAGGALRSVLPAGRL